MKKLIIRILLILVTAFFLLQVIRIFRSSFIDLIFYYFDDTPGIYETIQPSLHVFTAIFVFWLVFLLFLEISFYFKNSFIPSRLLTNLRYAPIVAFAFSIFIVLLFDFGMIEYSKWKIQNYVFSNSEVILKPNFRLHNDYRGWCGNGASAHENYLYFETASAGINDENPYVRSRSLLMTADVQNWINGGDDRFDAFLAKACLDSNVIVHNAAETYLTDSNSNCQKILSSK